MDVFFGFTKDVLIFQVDRLKILTLGVERVLLIHRQLLEDLVFFGGIFNCYLAVQCPTLGHSQGVSLTKLMFITAFVQF